MSTTYTPSPWAIDVNKTGEVTVYEAVTLKNLDICTMGGNNNDGSNARLIAAAPDMLAALQFIAKSAFLPSVGITRAAIEAAIAKATGDAS